MIPRWGVPLSDLRDRWLGVLGYQIHMYVNGEKKCGGNNTEDRGCLFVKDYAHASLVDNTMFMYNLCIIRLHP